MAPRTLQVKIHDDRLRARIEEGEHNPDVLAEEFGCSPVLAALSIENIELQEKLKQNDRHFQRLVNQRVIFLVALDAEQKTPKMAYVEPGFFAEMPREPVTLAWWSENMVHPDDRIRFVATIMQSRAERRFSEVKYRVRHADGQWRHVVSQYTPLLDNSGQVLEWICSMINVTDEEKEAQEKIQRSERRYRALINTRAQIVWRANAMGVVTELLSADKNLIGPDFVQPSLEHWLGRIHPDDREKFLATWKSAIIAQTDCHNEYRVRREDNGWADVISQSVPLRDADGTVEEWIGTVTDVTRQHLLEEELRQSQKMQAMGQLAGGVAHDFNNLLTVIFGYSDLLRDHVPNDKRASELLREIKHASQRAATLTQQLLAFSRKAVIAPRILNLSEVVRELAKMLNRLIGENIRFQLSVASEPVYIHADRGQLEQVLMNLAVNARDAMPAGGTLTVETNKVQLDEAYASSHAEVQPGDYVLLTVSDTGCGISPEIKAHIFEPFFTTKERGTGLGLATVYGIVRQSGGHMTVSSEVGHGSCFKIFLPRIAAAILTADIGNEAKCKIVCGHEMILLVEDELSVRAFARSALQMRGYTVIDAGSGQEALEKATRQDGPIDLLVTDVIMPGFGGRELADRLVKIQPSMKVLFVSGYTNDAIVHHGIRRAEMNFLEKPFGVDVLNQKVREVLDQPAVA